MTASSQDRIPEYIEWAERDREAVNNDATAKQLAILTFRASRNIYFFADADYQRESLSRIRVQALARVASFTDLMDAPDIMRYQVVADMAQEFEDRVTPGQEVRIAPEETRIAYDDLLTKNGDGILAPEGEKTMHQRISKVLNIAEKLAGEVQDLHEPDANIAHIRGLYAKIGDALEDAIADYQASLAVSDDSKL